MAKEKAKGAAKPKVQYVTKAEFDSLEKKIDENNASVVDLLKGLGESMNKDAHVEKLEGGPQSPDAVTVREVDGFKHFLPDNYQNIFEKYFDMNDGFLGKVDFPGVDPKGGIQGGIIFTIYVPKKLSNATPAHLDHYKKDLRSKRLSAENTLKSFEDWCKAVTKNLRYELHLARK